MSIKELTKKGYNYLERRFELLFNPNFLPKEKLSLFFSKNLRKGSNKVLLQRMKTNTANEKYFQIGGYNIFYQPPYEVKDEEVLLDGITQVLDESFLFPYILSKEVQVKPGDVIFDLGGNIGSIAMTLAKMTGPQGKVYTFEPVVYKTIEKNLKENNVQNVVVVPKGVAERSYSTQISVSDFCLDSSLVNNDYINKSFHNKLDVDIISLDDFVEQNNIRRVDFIKMDIEGFEELAIRGAHQLILKHKPKWSISSYHTDFQNEKQHPKLVALLKKYGYNVKEYESRHIFAW